MPRSNQDRKVEIKVSLSSATHDYMSGLADRKSTPISELARTAIDRGLAAIAEDENKKNVEIKTSLRGRLASLILGIDDPEELEQAIAAIEEIRDR